MIKRPLIIDCDPGTDDAQCIMMLNACGLFDIRGITPVHGNVPLEFTSKNALFLSKYYGINRPVYKHCNNNYETPGFPKTHKEICNHGWCKNRRQCNPFGGI